MITVVVHNTMGVCYKLLSIHAMPQGSQNTFVFHCCSSPAADVAIHLHRPSDCVCSPTHPQTRHYNRTGR